MKDIYSFAAIFNCSEDGISVEFPDLPGCLPYANTIDTAVANAKEALELHLFQMEKDKNEIPEPTDLSLLNQKLENNAIQALFQIEIHMPTVRERFDKNCVRKTVLIPFKLNAKAKQEGVDLSKLLNDELIKRFGL